MLAKKVYETKAEKRTDFIIGFVGFFILNVIIGVVIMFLAWVISELGLSNDLAALFGLILYCFPLLVNIGLILYTGFTRSWIALGMLAAFGALFVLTIIAGIFLTVACFVVLSNL